MSSEVELRVLRVFEPAISTDQLSEEAAATLIATFTEAGSVSPIRHRLIRTSQLLKVLAKKAATELEQRGGDPTKVIEDADLAFSESDKNSDNRRDKRHQATILVDTSAVPSPTKKVAAILKIATAALTLENPQITNQGLYAAIVEHHHNQAARILRKHLEGLKTGKHNSFSSSEAGRKRELVMPEISATF